ncbi:alpha/beta fold hydrolase [Pseudonocardia alaniniphila]|uniref:Alpha/beta hydrolase n=1 Tax=Pseudonocardia alaniniphila TaxID=75291 RepID=A0ABS9TP67_9PSEU|nr:alpha/beta hydrolase [Pseudonocardia alaniniphila]MCH6170345.1 alpha/beta hydrolase [Pseudonocardia alaniniphila]
MTAAITTRTLDAPGATITYDVHGSLGDARTLLLVGSPMDATGFTTLAGHFTDRPVVTYDPRGTGRSMRTDGHGEITPGDHAGDLRRVVEAIGGEPVDVLASSGGAVNSLAWVAEHGEQVHTLVAHEPPLATLLRDHRAFTSAIEDMHQTYQRDGLGPAMAKFIFIVGFDGELPDGFQFPPLDPAQFGLPVEDDGSRDDALLAQNLRNCTGYRPDMDALRAAGTRIVMARGEASGQTMAARGADALAEVIGAELVRFPGDHGGFLGGEYGMRGEPDGFAQRLRDVLDGA